MLLQPAANESALFKNVVKKLSTLTCDNATAKILSPLLWEIREFANVWPGCLRPPTHEHRTARERCVHYGPPNLVSQWLLGFPVHIQVMKSNHCCGFLMPIVYDDGLDGHVWPHVGAHDGVLPSMHTLVEQQANIPDGDWFCKNCNLEAASEASGAGTSMKDEEFRRGI